MKENLEFFITTMPDSRPADYYLGCLEGSVFMDFNKAEFGCIRLIRISFDGYGCCDLDGEAFPMDEMDSGMFEEMIETGIIDQFILQSIIKKTISANRHLIWEDALRRYNLD